MPDDPPREKRSGPPPVVDVALDPATIVRARADWAYFRELAQANTLVRSWIAGFDSTEAPPPDPAPEPADAPTRPVPPDDGPERRKPEATEPEAAPIAMERPEPPTPARPEAAIDEIAIANALLTAGFALEAAFVRHFKDRDQATWQELAEAVRPGEKTSWATIKVWATRVKNALTEVAPGCRLTFTTTVYGHLLIKKPLPE